MNYERTFAIQFRITMGNSGEIRTLANVQIHRYEVVRST